MRTLCRQRGLLTNRDRRLEQAREPDETLRIRDPRLGEIIRKETSEGRLNGHVNIHISQRAGSHKAVSADSGHARPREASLRDCALELIP